MRLRLRLSIIGAASALLASAAAAQSADTTYHTCSISGKDRKTAYMTYAVTEPFPVDKVPGGMSTIEGAFHDFLRDLVNGRVSIPGIDPDNIAGGSCIGGTRDIAGQEEMIRNKREDHKEVFVLFPSPIGRDGRYRRPGAASAQPSPSPARPAASQPRQVRRDNPLGKTPNQVKYELAQAVHQARLARLEREKAEIEAKKARQRADAQAVLSSHEQDLARHRQVVAANEREQAEYRARLARPPEAPEEKVEFKEGVVLCAEPRDGFLSVLCRGPLQNVTTRMDVPATQVALGQACGSDRSIRDLGMVAGYRAFGCGFGIHPTARDYPGNTDVPAQLGISYVPGRASYFCPKSKLAYCR